MSGFSLSAGHRQGGGGEEQEAVPPDNLFLYGSGGGGGSNRNEEISYTRGFELWQQHQHQQQQIQRQLYPSGGMLAFSDEQQLGGGRSSGSAGRGSGSGGGGVSCQDCGNQAKKDCAHLRCRTCCKSRNFQCPTHVKSTWVPASKRRERAAAAAAQQQQQQQQQQQTNRGAAPPGSGEPSKRPREICTRFPSTIVATSSGGGGMEGALSFPAEVSSPAVFRCVRVSPMDESEDEFAYQTAVSIGGHVFKGILYDQGRESNYPPSPPRSSATAAAIAMAPSSSTAPATAGLLDPSSLYPAPLSAFMAGTQFFPHHPRP
ncbi:protein EXPRESSION OF TERPENOIDS 1-like [Typha angustifolia]|uniref:protein EXPRESSION OF TERPENOIDS 1-like n=1 Tax=Typha angustifolia TaxID=59011 RepID=UPI003C2ACC93